MKDELVLIIDGRLHHGWESAQVVRSIERGAHMFSLTLSDRWGATEKTNRTNPRTVKTGMSVEVYINDDLLSTGFLDQISPSYDSTSHVINVQGISKVADLVSCSTAGKQFKNQSLLQICKTLCKPFAITVTVDSSVAALVGKPFASVHKLDLGEPIWGFLEELARLRGVLLTSTPEGNLHIARAGSAVADEALVLGQNVERASGQYSTRDVFSEYVIAGQQPSTPKRSFILPDSTLKVARAGAVDTRVSSSAIARHRPFYISSDAPLSAAQKQARADWQKNVNEGRAERTTYTVSGWRQNENGRIWQPNELVDVVDEWVGLDDRRLIVETVIGLDDDGSTTELVVMPKEAFAAKPILPSASKKAKARSFILPPKELS